MLTYKLKGIDKYIINTINDKTAVMFARSHGIGVTENDLEEITIDGISKLPRAYNNMLLTKDEIDNLIWERT